MATPYTKRISESLLWKSIKWHLDVGDQRVICQTNKSDFSRFTFAALSIDWLFINTLLSTDRPGRPTDWKYLRGPHTSISCMEKIDVSGLSEWKSHTLMHSEYIFYHIQSVVYHRLPTRRWKNAPKMPKLEADNGRTWHAFIDTKWIPIRCGHFGRNGIFEYGYAYRKQPIDSLSKAFA